MLKITLIKSISNLVKPQKLTVLALGLKKIGSNVIKKDCPQIRGMINKVSHLIKVDEVKEV